MDYKVFLQLLGVDIVQFILTKGKKILKMLKLLFVLARKSSSSL